MIYLVTGLRLRHVILIILAILFAHSADAGTIKTLVMDAPDGKSTISVKIGGDNLSAPNVYAMTEGSARIVIDFPDDDTKLKAEPHTQGQTKIAGQGPIRLIRQAARGTDGTRLVLDLADGASLSGHQFENGTLIVSVAGLNVVTMRQVQTEPRYFKGKIPYPIPKPARLYEPRLPPVIVIDPGHGGRDPGAVGQLNTYEKSVTLKAAQELKALLEKSGAYTVYLTRDGDRYVDHDDRIKIARQKNADLFISIHADSTGSPSTRGASVYTLADRAIGRSKRIVNNQNWIMDVDLSTQSDPVGDILVDLAQRKTFTQSGEFADHLINQLSGSTHLVRNSHRRAGYYVLLAPDVPAVLLELGFISNKQDEKLLKSARHRKKVLKSVKTAIDRYFNDQNP